MLNPTLLEASANITLDSSATRGAHVMIQGDDASVIVLEVSADGSVWSEAMPAGVTTLVNRGPFVVEFAQGYTYRLTNDATADADVFQSSI